MLGSFEENQEVGTGGGQPDEPDGSFSDDAQGAFGADDELFQIVA